MKRLENLPILWRNFAANVLPEAPVQSKDWEGGVKLTLIYLEFPSKSNRLFRNMDDDGSKSLSLDEFKKGITEFGIDMEEDVNFTLYEV